MVNNQTVSTLVSEADPTARVGGEEAGRDEVIVRSPFPDVAVPETALTPFVLARARALADKPALVDGPSGRTLTYKQLENNIRRAAIGFRRRGLAKGDVVAIFSPNLPEFAVAFHAAATLGGAVTTINPLATADELAGQLRDSGAVFLVAAPVVVEKALRAARQAGVREVFVFGDAAGATPFEALLAEDGPPTAVAIDPQRDLVALPYSSGTTGLPKGVMLSHSNLVANIRQMDAVEPVGDGDVFLGILPFFHAYGLVLVLNRGLANGATIVSMPRFEFEPCLALMQRHRVSRAYLVPPIVLALAKQPIVERYPLPSLKSIVWGAAPMSAAAAEACAARLGIPVRQGFGMTECSAIVHLNPDEPNKPGSIGPAVPMTECKVVDPATGASLGPHERGELWVRGPQVMRGYLNQPEATAGAVDAAGWLHTGDLGYADEDGYFYIVDRLKELIKYKGYQVAPAELEAVLTAHPAVADAAVVGSPDEAAGEVPIAFVALKGEATAAELMAHMAGRVAPYKRIRRVEFVERVPRSPSGKILRRLLVERERARGA
jgi:acyl-CoA synthetase (AMP-forming)/AMP-acid ligase II